MPLALDEYANDRAALNARLSAWAEPISSSAAPRLTATPMPDEASLVLVPAVSNPFSITAHNRHRLLGTAMGTAYLAACTEEERETLLHMVRQGDDPVAVLARDAGHVAAVVAQTRQRGFGLREAGPNGDSTSVAVPIMVAGHVEGGVSLTMFRIRPVRAAWA